jgi:hypothetical protein
MATAKKKSLTVRRNGKVLYGAAAQAVLKSRQRKEAEKIKKKKATVKKNANRGSSIAPVGVKPYYRSKPGQLSKSDQALNRKTNPKPKPKRRKTNPRKQTVYRHVGIVRNPHGQEFDAFQEVEVSANATDLFESFYGKPADEVQIIEAPGWMPDELVGGAKVSAIEYIAEKWTDNFEPSIYRHELGEEGGELPTMAFDPESGTIILPDGGYYLTPEGIRD